jgi:hypothetical protein
VCFVRLGRLLTQRPTSSAAPPAAVEVGQLLSQVTKVKETLTSLSLPSAAGPAWRGVAAGADALALAFDLPKP